MRYMTDVLVVVSNRDIKEHKAVFVQLIEKVVNEFGYEKVNESSICKKKRYFIFIPHSPNNIRIRNQFEQ